MTSSGENCLNIRTNTSPKWDRTRLSHIMKYFARYCWPIIRQLKNLYLLVKSESLFLGHFFYFNVTANLNNRLTTPPFELSYCLSIYTNHIRWISCLISFVWDQSICQERKHKQKLQNEKYLSTVGYHSIPGSLSLRDHHLIHVARTKFLWMMNFKSIICFYEVRSINKVVILEHDLSIQHGVSSCI